MTKLVPDMVSVWSLKISINCWCLIGPFTLSFYKTLSRRKNCQKWYREIEKSFFKFRPECVGPVPLSTVWAMLNFYFDKLLTSGDTSLYASLVLSRIRLLFGIIRM